MTKLKLLSLSLIICSLILSPVRVAASPIHPQTNDDALIQTLEATAHDLGASGILNEFTYGGYKTYYILEAGVGFISASVYNSEAKALSMLTDFNYIAWGFESISFHGYEGLYTKSVFASTGQDLPDDIRVVIGKYLIKIEGSEDSPYTSWDLAETFYQNALLSGLMSEGGVTTLPTVTPQATADQVSPTPTLAPGAGITLSASKKGYETAYQTLANPDNLATITINGTVRDAESGVPLDIAGVEVYNRAADFAATISSGDGSFTLVINVPGGQGSGNSSLDFNLQPLKGDTLELTPSQTIVAADGVSTVDLILLAFDPNGDPLADHEIRFSVSGADGTGTVTPELGTTSETGYLKATYTSFKPPADSSFVSPEHLVTITATDTATGVSTSLDLQVNQNTIFASGNQFIPASIKDSFPSQIYLTMRDAFGNLLSNAPVNLRVKDAANGCLKESPESSACQTELALQTDAEGRLKASFHWRGKVNMAEAAASVIISEAGTNAQITHNIQVHGLDIAITNVKEAGFTGYTGHQAFLKIYFKERFHPDLSLDRFNQDSVGQMGLRVSIFQFESDGTATSLPFEGTGSWAFDEGGSYIKMYATPHFPNITPVNDGTTWYTVRIDAVDQNDDYLPDTFRGNNDTIIALTTGSTDGWLDIFLSEGILTPRSYLTVFVKCVARFVPVLGDTITVIDTLNQVYNSDVLSLSQSTAQVLTEELQRRATPGKLTSMKASTLNNIVSCVQDAYGVYKSNNQGSAPSIGVCACQGSAPSIGVCASLIDPQRSEDFDPAEYQQALDTFVHGFFMDEPDRQVLVIYGLPGDSVNMLNAQGADVDASEWMSAGEALVIYILPPEEDFTLEVDTDQPFDIAFYEAGVDETTRQTYRHSQQPSDVITATMDLGANTDLTLQIDADQDGQVDQSLPPESFTLDVVPPTITNIEPAHESSVSQTPLSLLVQFSDNAGGSGIDPESVRVVFDGEDRSGDAAITEEGLFLDLGVLGEGEHTAEVRVYDKDGNLARVEWTFSVGSGLWILSGLVFIAILGGGALLLLGTAVFVVILIARRKSSQKLSKASAPQQNIPPQEAVRSGSGCLLTLVLTALLTLVVFGVLFLIVFEFIPWLKIPVLGGANLGDILKIGGIGILITFLGVLVLNSGIKSVRQTGQATGALNVLFGVISIIFGLLMLLVGLGLIALALYQQVLPYLGY